MTFDLRAAQAARSLRASVAGIVPAPIPVVVRRQRRSMVMSFGMAAIAVFFIVGIATAMPTLFEPAQVANEPSLPNPDAGPIAIEPDDKPNDGQLVELDEPVEAAAVRQTISVSDSAKPYTVFYGTAEPGSTVTAVSGYAEGSVTASPEGEFELKLRFDPPPPAGEEFVILVVADGQQYEFRFISLFDPANVEFSAHQTYGASDDPEAFEKFFGSAPAGSVVTATSPYGSAETVADDEGHWSLKLWFDGPLPLDEPFDIVVASGDQSFTFAFVSVFELPPPALTVVQANSQSDSSSPYIKFTGTAPEGTHLLAQSSYGSHDIVVGESGEFAMKLWFTSLPPAGVQFPITFSVDHEFYGTFYFTSYYDKTTTTTSGSVEVDQYNTESWDSNPWIKFHVYGPGGTQIQIISPYGSVTETIAKSGDYVRLYFSQLPPAGQKFNVTVKINGETFGSYPFTSHFDPANVGVTVNQYITEWPANEGPNPWVKFYGTAPIGTQVQIISGYGSWSFTTEAIEWNSGHKTFSPMPPAGVTFPITVKVNGETFGTYSYTSYFDSNYVEVTPVVTSSETAEPYAKVEYWAPAGTSIQLTSPYGNSDMITLGSTGGGHLKLWFSTLPPAGETFTVTIKVNGSTFGSFGFTSWYVVP